MGRAVVRTTASMAVIVAVIVVAVGRTATAAVVRTTAAMAVTVVAIGMVINRKRPRRVL